MPQASIDPVAMAAATVLRLQTIVSRELAASEAVVAAIVSIMLTVPKGRNLSTAGNGGMSESPSHPSPIGATYVESSAEKDTKA